MTVLCITVFYYNICHMASAPIFPGESKRTCRKTCRSFLLVGVFGLEPKASSSRTKRATNCAIPRRLIYNNIQKAVIQILFIFLLQLFLPELSVYFLSQRLRELKAVALFSRACEVHTLSADVFHDFHKDPSAVYDRVRCRLVIL